MRLGPFSNNLPLCGICKITSFLTSFWLVLLSLLVNDVTMLLRVQHSLVTNPAKIDWIMLFRSVGVNKNVCNRWGEGGLEKSLKYNSKGLQ